MNNLRIALQLVASRLAFVAVPLALIGALLWGIAGALGAVALVMLVAFFSHAYKLVQLSQWLDDPDPKRAPEGSGKWGTVFAKLYRLRRDEIRSQQSLANALARFQQAAEAIPDGAVMLDAGNRIEWCNPAAQRDFAISIPSDRGQLITNLARQPAFVDYLAAADFRDPLTMKGQETPDQVLSVLLIPFGEDRKLLLARDITQIEKLETTRRDFIANVSHELRTPLTVLAGFVETLARSDEKRSDLFARALTHMESQTQRMQSLVEDLLTLSRLEDTRNPLIEHPIDVGALIASLLVDAEQLSAGRHRISANACAAWIVGNRDELRSAFSNLVTNALRYTPASGSIEVTWEKAADGAAFRVRDSGEGIAAEHIPRLTERFYRVDRGRSRAAGGTGLGLAIVKHVLNRHQAWLEVESEPGRGSTFSAIFPASRICEAAPRPSEAAAA